MGWDLGVRVQSLEVNTHNDQDWPTFAEGGAKMGSAGEQKHGEGRAGDTGGGRGKGGGGRGYMEGWREGRREGRREGEREGGREGGREVG